MATERIKLGNNESYEIFVKNNERKFWDLIIKTLEKMSEDDELDNLTAFIVYGGKLKRDKEIIVQRSSAIDIINNAIPKMELYEEYEICNNLIKMKEKFKTLS